MELVIGFTRGSLSQDTPCTILGGQWHSKSLFSEYFGFSCQISFH